ncbi:MAG: class I SAM-dependent methyltransferase [Pirellulaceae bacterium]|nr:class I SAM-dependent methyltransferase [Pirellulaceae bacterium]
MSQSNFERQRDHWRGMALRFAHIGPPLRPTAQDLAVYQQAIDRQARRYRGRSFRVLLLGVTREIACLRWPENSELIAIDRSAEMVRACWIGDVAGRRQARCGDWLKLAPELGPWGLVLGDGSLSSLQFPDETRQLLSHLHDTLLPGGRLVLRCFVEHAARESPQAVIHAMRGGEIESFHAAKFRLAMALQSSSGAGVHLAAVWRAWNDFALDLGKLAVATAWSRETIQTIDAYRDSPGFQSFPTLSQFQAVAAEFFTLESQFVPGYEMGDRCPMLTFVQRER